MNISKLTSSIPPSPTMAIDAKYKELLTQGVDIISFGAGEPDFDTPLHIKEAAKKAIDEGYTKYTAAAGDISLRKAICTKLKNENGLDYEPNQIVVSNGAKHALFNAFSAILNPNDEVIIPTPYWVSYPEMVKLAHGIPKFLLTSEEDGYKININTLNKAITPQTKAIVLNSPSNPCGVLYSKGELEAIAEVATQNNIYVISDEIYEKIIFDGAKCTSIASLGDKIKGLTIVINGVSKSYAMTGWRIGFSASNPEIAKVMANIQSHEASNPSSISQKAALAAYKGPQDEIAKMCQAFEERRNFLMSSLDKIPNISYIKPQGAFYLMLDVRKLQKEEEDTNAFCQRLLDEAKITIVPGSGFGMEGFARWSFATSLDNIEDGLKRLERFVNP